MLEILRRIEGRGAIEAAARIRQRAGKVFRYAIAEGTVRLNPCDGFDEALEPPAPKRKWLAIVVLEDLRTLVAKVDVSTSSPVTRLASRFIGLTAQRLGMVRGMPWTEILRVDCGRIRRAPRLRPSGTCPPRG